VRKLITIFFFLAFLNSKAQYVNRYFTAVDDLGITNYYSFCMPIDSVAYKHGIIFYCPGSGQTGAGNYTKAKADAYGVTRNANAVTPWDGLTVQYDSTTRFILCSVQQGTGSFGADRYWKACKKILDMFAAYIDKDQVHLTGVSLGGIMSQQMMQSLADTNYSNFTTVFLVSPGGRTTPINNTLGNQKYYVGKGGRIAYTIGASDTVTTDRYKPQDFKSASDSVAGSFIFKVWNTGQEGYTSQGHGNWDVTYNPAQRFAYMGNRNYYEWAAQYTKAPKANAQNTISTNGSAVVLNGITNGWYKTVAWTKVSGSGGSISNSSSDTTTVTGLTAGTYVYRLTVTNTHTAVVATKDVTVYVSGFGTGDLKTRRYTKKRIAP
jgi:hypothetical protein